MLIGEARRIAANIAKLPSPNGHAAASIALPIALGMRRLKRNAER